jgi:hypothetical protein
MPGFPEVIVCDGEPPTKPDYPEFMEFVVVRNPSAESRFPAVIAPSRGTGLVEDVTFELEENRVGYNVSTTKGTWRIAVGNQGEYRVEAERRDGSTYLFQANPPDRELKFTIESVDYDNNTVTIKETIEAPDLLKGEVAVLRGNGHSASYTVAEADERSLRFEGPALTGLFQIDEASAEEISTKTRLSGYGTQISARSFIGMALVGEDRQTDSWVKTYEDSRFGLGKTTSFPDANSDERTIVYFADHAPGYEVCFTPWLEKETSSDGKVTKRSNFARTP